MRNLRTEPRFSRLPTLGRDRYRQASVTSTHDTAEGAYARLDAIATKLQRDGAPVDTLELYVVDTDRQPVARPGGRIARVTSQNRCSNPKNYARNG